jgi:hypothetical protein
MQLEELQAYLEAHEMRLKQRASEKVTYQTLQAKFTKKGKDEAINENGKEKWKKKNQNDSKKESTSSNKNSKKNVKEECEYEGSAMLLLLEVWPLCKDLCLQQRF